jgi:AraC-like DNA-binding protein
MRETSTGRVGRLHPSYARVIAIALKRRGINANKLLAEFGTSVADLETGTSLISFDLLRQLVRAFRSSDVGGLGLEVGTNSPVTVHGAMGIAMISSATLDEALRTLAGFGGARGRTVRFRYAQSARYGEIEMLENFDFGDMRWLVLEAAMLQVSSLITAVVGESLPRLVFQFPYPPPQWSRKYASALHGRIEFNAKTMRLRIPREHLRLRGISADPHVRKAALRQCEREAAEISSNRRRDLVPVIKAHLEEVRGEFPTLEALADTMDSSPRSLIRWLREKGLRYRDLVDEVRIERACWRLINTGDTVEQIAVDLGYSDPSNFSRTFRRWQGMVPSEFRRKSAK